MIAGVTKLGRTTRSYKGFAFSYLPNAKRILKVSLSVYINGEFTHRRFHTITEAVAFIDDALANGATLNGNRLMITKVGA
jgi:adenine/guanine phosphoribosyltransferase-like PRPP-binding protein